MLYLLGTKVTKQDIADAGEGGTNFSNRETAGSKVRGLQTLSSFTLCFHSFARKYVCKNLLHQICNQNSIFPIWEKNISNLGKQPNLVGLG